MRGIDEMEGGSQGINCGIIQGNISLYWLEKGNVDSEVYVDIPEVNLQSGLFVCCTFMS